jgi:hypothetical protein
MSPTSPVGAALPGATAGDDTAGPEPTITVPSNGFGRGAGEWSGLGSPRLRPLAEADFANVRVPDDLTEEPSPSGEAATEPATMPPATESVTSDAETEPLTLTPPPLTMSTPEVGTAPREIPPSPRLTIPEAFLDAPRLHQPAQGAGAENSGGKEVPKSLRQTSAPAPGPETGQMKQDAAFVASEPAANAPGHSSGAAQESAPASTPFDAPRTATSSIAATANTARPVAPGAEQTVRASDGRVIGAVSFANALPTPSPGVSTSDGGSGVGTGGGAAVTGARDPLELIRREYKEAQAAMAAAAMTLREAEAAAALAGSSDTARCELLVAQGHMQDSSERYDRAKQFWSVFGA